MNLEFIQLVFGFFEPLGYKANGKYMVPLIVVGLVSMIIDYCMYLNLKIRRFNDYFFSLNNCSSQK